MDYFKLFAYLSFIFAIVGIVGTALYWLDKVLDPEAEETCPALHCQGHTA